jgi:hypothetical protein
MKKKLLYFTSLLLFSAVSVNAQIDVWDFGAEQLATPAYNNMIQVNTINENLNTTVIVANTAGFKWPLTVSVGAAGNTLAAGGIVVIGKLTLTPGADRIRTTNTTITRYDSTNGAPVGVTGVYPAFVGATNTGMINFQGVGSASARNISMDLAAGESATFFIQTTATGSTYTTGLLNYVVPSGAAAIASKTLTSGQLYEIHITADVAGKYTIYDSQFKLSLYRAYRGNVTNALLGTKNFQKTLDVNVYAKDGKIFLSNIKSSTKVEVYSVLGSLVKSTQADADNSLDINSGVYIVKVKSAEGEKSVKVVVQ